MYIKFIFYMYIIFLISCKFSILCTDDGIKSEKLLLNIVFKPLVFDLPGPELFSQKSPNYIFDIVNGLLQRVIDLKMLSFLHGIGRMINSCRIFNHVFVRSVEVSLYCNFKLYLINCGSNRREESCKKGVLKNFAKFTGKTVARVSFLIKLEASGLQLYSKSLSDTGVFP